MATPNGGRIARIAINAIQGLIGTAVSNQVNTVAAQATGGKVQSVNGTQVTVNLDDGTTGTFTCSTRTLSKYDPVTCVGDRVF